MNVAILLGTVASAVKRQDFERGGSVSRFRLKTADTYNQDGVLKERTNTHLIDVYNPYLQEKIVPLLREGQLISLQGSIESRNTAKQGEPPKWTTAVVLRNSGVINIPGGANSGMSVREDAREDEEPRVDHRPRPSQSDVPPPAGDGLDDDLPF